MRHKPFTPAQLANRARRWTNSRRLVYADAEEIRKLWQNDWTFKAIAAEWQISQKMVGEILDWKKLAQDDGLRPEPKYLNKDNVRLMRKLKKEGKTYAQISEIVAITPDLVSKVVRRVVWDWFEPVKPKRIRRTNAQIAADLAAEELLKAASAPPVPA